MRGFPLHFKGYQSTSLLLMNDQRYGSDDLIDIAEETGDPVYNAFSDLPWIIAVAAMIAVGGISYYNIEDFWISFDRACIAFIVFWSLGSFVRRFLEGPSKNGKRENAGAKNVSPAKKGPPPTPAGLNLSSDEPESRDISDSDKE